MFVRRTHTSVRVPRPRAAGGGGWGAAAGSCVGAAAGPRVAAALSAIRKHLSGSYAHARCALRAHASVKFSGSCAGGCALTSNSGKKLVKTNF